MLPFALSVDLCLIITVVRVHTCSLIRDLLVAYLQCTGYFIKNEPISQYTSNAVERVACHYKERSLTFRIVASRVLSLLKFAVGQGFVSCNCWNHQRGPVLHVAL
jgi:hypothetical protein